MPVNKWSALALAVSVATAQSVLAGQQGEAQGFVGFGVDAYGMLGIELGSGRGRAGTGLFPLELL